VRSGHEIRRCRVNDSQRSEDDKSGARDSRELTAVDAPRRPKHIAHPQRATALPLHIQTLATSKRGLALRERLRLALQLADSPAFPLFQIRSSLSIAPGRLEFQDQDAPPTTE
jgi:hypothetical protein